MKILIKLMLIATFAVVVFLPQGIIASWLYWSMFVLMFFLLWIFYWTSYWVGIKTVETLCGEPILFSMFCGKVPPIASEDLVRGRLVVTSSQLMLFQKKEAKGYACVWSLPINGIASFEVGKAVASRKGLILNLVDGTDARFTYMRMGKRKSEFTAALGWAPEPLGNSPKSIDKPL